MDEIISYLNSSRIGVVGVLVLAMAIIGRYLINENARLKAHIHTQDKKYVDNAIEDLRTITSKLADEMHSLGEEIMRLSREVAHMSGLLTDRDEDQG